MTDVLTTVHEIAPLESCLLVDYRLSSRSQLKQHIATTGLFDQVLEPGSMVAGLELVSTRRVETCIFGPSVKSDKIQDFILTSQISGESTKCAFVAFQPRDRREEVRGAHALLDFPCSQSHFNVGIVQALANANGGALPQSRKIDPHTGKLVSLKERLARLELPSTKTTDADDVSHSSEPWPRILIETVQKHLPGMFYQLLEIHPFNLKFRIDGRPSEFTVTEIRRLIWNSFPNTDEVPAMPRFKEALESLLYKWVKRGTLQGRAAADFVLKRDLRQLLQAE